MAMPPKENPQAQFLLSDLSTRVSDINEKNNLIKERVLLLGKNFISSKEESEDEIREIKRDNQEIKREIERLKKISNTLLAEFNKFVKRDELVLVERMLKDFQPLDFVRKKDLPELEHKIKTTKKKTKHTSK